MLREAFYSPGAKGNANRGGETNEECAQTVSVFNLYAGADSKHNQSFTFMEASEMFGKDVKETLRVFQIKCLFLCFHLGFSCGSGRGGQTAGGAKKVSSREAAEVSG